MRSLIAAVAVIVGAVLSATAGHAGAQDRVHADSFGNLVIHSPAGYKRIIVGMGHTAAAYKETGSYYDSDEPRVVHLEGLDPERHMRRCSRPPYIWHGRSRMYGLSDGVVPQAPLVCR